MRVGLQEGRPGAAKGRVGEVRVLLWALTDRLLALEKVSEGGQEYGSGSSSGKGESEGGVRSCAGLRLRLLLMSERSGLARGARIGELAALLRLIIRMVMQLLLKDDCQLVQRPDVAVE